ncbi:hypothetical protein [uncultured Devosia sp.]|uniref:hypothetical protein n=1 Tax=uncultured Devosia sp. TaxID=211434 RepID=UPI0035C9A819
MSLLSDPRPGSARFIATYGAVAVLALLELAIAWQAIHPDVPPDYRAYYIDQTTTCMRQPVSGAYSLGATIDFRSGGDDTTELRPCGWEGPAGDGLHLLGETARLRFAVSEPNGSLTLTLALSAINTDGAPDQRVVVSANDTPLGTAIVAHGQSATVSFAIPAGLATATGLLDIVLDVPDAVSGRPGDSNTRKRSIKLTAATLSPA